MLRHEKGLLDGSRVGIVVIGRNEGERLRQSLLSMPSYLPIVYVDSGSTDGSQLLAKELGARLVELDVPPKFTAARARNAGLAELLQIVPGLTYVQMLDGDCRMSQDWLTRAVIAIEDDPTLAVVFGRRRELHPRASIYNQMCDFEWDVPIGVADSCGGDALFRVEALVAVDCYTPELIAGEEPDLCLRLRRLGWRIMRIDAEMSEHDAAILHFSQWWKRTQRGGHAFAELTFRHGRAQNNRWTRQVSSILFWGPLMALAVGTAALGLLSGKSGFFFFSGGCALLYLAQTFKIGARLVQQGASARDAAIQAGLLMLGKLPQLQGIAQFHGRRLSGAQSTLIEYKSDP